MHYDSDGMPLVSPHGTPHYYGNTVRMLFIASAIVLLLAATTGARLPISGSFAVITAIALMVLAGITNPTLTWIHWTNGGVAILETILFSTSAIDYYRMGTSILNHSFYFIEALALLFLISLYYTTKTVRGVLLRKPPPLHLS